MEIKTLTTPYHTLIFTYPYRTEVVKYCKLLQSSWGWQSISFDGTYKGWVFSRPEIVEAIIQQYPETKIDQAVKDLCHITELELLAEEVRLKELTKVKVTGTSEIEIPGLKADLYPFQKAGVEFLVKSKGRAILADDPGLGKTLQSIGAMLALKSTLTLVVCPATMKYTWEAEVKKWSDLKPIVINTDTNILAAKPDGTGNGTVLIINYDLLKKHYSVLVNLMFDMMVLDEAHYIKTSNTIRSRVIRSLATNVKHVIMLTGTPILNRPAELFNPLSILYPKEWNNYYSFVRRYCNAHRTRFGLDVSGSSNTEELAAKLDKMMLRRRKEEVMKDLPEKVRVEVPVVLSKEAAKTYDKAYNNFIDFLRENKGKKPSEVAKALQAEKLVRLNALREVSLQGKLDDAIEIIENTIAGGEKIIVFGSFVAPLHQLKECFGDKAVLLTGSTPNEERFELVKRFQNDDSVKVFIGGIKSAGVGITLTKASNVLFLDYSWTPADHKQAEDRAHRIGSTHSSITIYTMHASGTIDDLMQKMLNKKRKVIEGIVGEGDDQSAMQMVLEEITNSIN